MAIHDFIMLEPADIVSDLVILIESQLPTFSLSEEFVNILEKKKNENQHSLSFCAYMTNVCKSRFYFARENAQKGARVIDIAVYKGGILVFTIEAKLLPTPKGKSTKERDEHEYVYGRGAGIQRFKEGHHGRDNVDNLLLESGLIGFLKDNSFDFWHGKVNQWINDANWGHDEILSKIYFDSVGKLMSRHIRFDHSTIILHHFWVKVPM